MKGEEIVVRARSASTHARSLTVVETFGGGPNDPPLEVHLTASMEDGEPWPEPRIIADQQYPLNEKRWGRLCDLVARALAAWREHFES